MNGCRVRYWQLETSNIAQKRVCIPYEDQNTLIEQSAVALITLIEHSSPYLDTPFEKSWVRPWKVCIRSDQAR